MSTQPDATRTIQFAEAQETLDELMCALKGVQDWRERVELSHGMTPPTAYMRVLLWLYLHEARGGKPVPLALLGRNVAISSSGISNVVKRMAFDCLLTITTIDNTKVVTLTPEGALMAIA